MQANWSLLLNIVFLGIIIGMILWRVKPFFNKKTESGVNQASKDLAEPIDDILHVRKISMTEEFIDEEEYDDPQVQEAPSLGIRLESQQPEMEAPKKTIMFFLAAQGQNIFAGYELLQTLLSCGLRYGDGGLFHRHQHASGQGPVLFSLAAATNTGVFDLQNMGAMSMKGLCMFMELSFNSTIDQERFELFVHTAKQLATELHALLLDEKQKPITADTIAKLERMIAQELKCELA
jgi:cell division protein ZipA